MSSEILRLELFSSTEAEMPAIHVKGLFSGKTVEGFWYKITHNDILTHLNCLYRIYTVDLHKYIAIFNL